MEKEEQWRHRRWLEPGHHRPGSERHTVFEKLHVLLQGSGKLRECLRYVPTPIHTLILVLSPPFSPEHSCSAGILVFLLPSPPLLQPCLVPLSSFLLSLFYFISPHFCSPSPSVMAFLPLSAFPSPLFFPTLPPFLQILLQDGRQFIWIKNGLLCIKTKKILLETHPDSMSYIFFS